MALGKRVRDALYVHRDAVSHLRPDHQKAVEQAETLAPGTSWNVARFEPDVVGLLLYEPFEAEPFPALLASTRIDLATGGVRRRDFSCSTNPLILHRKEQLVGPETPGIEAWASLTEALERLGCFKDPHLIGRRLAWRARLAAAGVRLEGHTLCPI